MPVQVGSVQTVVVCIPGTEGARGACPDGQVQTVTQAYMVAPTHSGFLDTSAEPFDPMTAGGFFGFAFAFTVSLWALAHGAGQVVKFVRTG